MNIKTVLGIVVTGVVLFFFGFAYWALNPLPYAAAHQVADPASVQKAAATLFPEDGFYMVPGPGNVPANAELLENGPSILLSIDHSPVPGADPVALSKGLVHNILSAVLLFLLWRNRAAMSARLGQGLLVGAAAAFVINGSQVIWWQQPLSWEIHHIVYYLLYFSIGAVVLNSFLPTATTDD